MSVVLTTKIDIAATPDEVWEVLSDFSSYGEWSNFTRVEGEAVEGTRLAIRMPGMSFKPTVTAATPGRKLEWSARIVSDRVFLGRHTFTLAQGADGCTRVTNTETFSGASVRPFRRFFAGSHDGSGYATFNKALKARVESRL